MTDGCGWMGGRTGVRSEGREGWRPCPSREVPKGLHTSLKRSLGGVSLLPVCDEGSGRVRHDLPLLVGRVLSAGRGDYFITVLIVLFGLSTSIGRRFLVPFVVFSRTPSTQVSTVRRKEKGPSGSRPREWRAGVGTRVPFPLLLGE